MLVFSYSFFFFAFLNYQLLFFLFNLFCFFGSSLFFLVSLARSLSIAFTLSKNQLLILLIIFFFFFKFSIWLISSVIFTIFFLLLIPDFVLIFLNLLSGRLGYLRFFMFLKRINCLIFEFSFWIYNTVSSSKTKNILKNIPIISLPLSC